MLAGILIHDLHLMLWLTKGFHQKKKKLTDWIPLPHKQAKELRFKTLNFDFVRIDILWVQFSWFSYMKVRVFNSQTSFQFSQLLLL